MKPKHIFQTSLITSLLLHSLFFGASTIWWMPGAGAVVTDAKKMFDLSTVQIEPPPLTQQSVIREYVEKIKFQKPSVPKSALPNKMKLEQTVKSPDLASLPTAQQSEKIEKDLSAEAAARALKQHFDNTERTINKDEQVELNIFQAIDLSAAYLDGTIEVPEHFSEQMFGFTPGHLENVSEVSWDTSSIGAMEAKSDSVSIDDMIDIFVKTFKDPRTGQGYYQIAARPGPSAPQMKVMPKEVIFLVDASLSIKEKRLDQFIKGIRYSVKNLNPSDRFNVYTFKDHINPLSSHTLVSSESSINRAVRFLSDLKPSEQTDIYEAFLESIDTQASMNPSYIVFLSDGRPTHGVTSSAKLIGKISRKNKRERSIFAFSGGKKVNRYLLDFMSYQNRGWSEYATETHEIGTRIKDLYDKIKNPLLVDLNYQVGGLDQAEVFPKYLPDFYLNTEFVVYGTFKDEDLFSMRVSGQINGQTKEFVFKKKLSDGSPGGPEIATYWAFNKFYHLISEATLNGVTPQIKRQLKELKKKFGIRSPYKI